MAGYRPKSLDELNSLYDKSINVKNEIYKKASDLEEKNGKYASVTEEIDGAETEAEKSLEEAATEEISGLVDDFIKSFGTPAPVRKVRPVTVPTTPVKSVSVPKAPEAAAPVQESALVPPVYAPVSEKPRLIRSNERNELFEDYKKVMDDEGDDELSRHRRSRRIGKKFFEKKNAPVAEDAEEKPEGEASVGTAEAEADGEAVQISYEGLTDAQETAEPEAPEIPETLENIDAVIEKVLGRPLPQDDEQEAEAELVIEPEEAVEEAAEIIEPQDIVEDEEDEAETVLEAEFSFKAELGSEDEEVSEEPVQEDYEEASYEDFDEAYEEEALPVDEGEIDPYDEYSAQYVIDRQEALQNEQYGQEEFEELEEPVKVKAPAKKRFAGKNILLVLLFLVLLLATAVSAVKAFSGINSDTLLLDKYYLYTADSSFAGAGINEGDLVVVSKEGIKEGDIFAYKKGDGEYGFAKLESVLNEESVVADTDGQKSIVFRNTLRGVFYQTYPMIGTIAALIISQYLYVVGALLVIAAILILIIALAFRSKKEKAPKKSKKKEALPELEDVPEQEETAEEEEQTYDAVDDDFRYLIREDGDDFDIYRNGNPEETDEEGLPVYKYEPEEYVNN